MLKNARIYRFTEPMTIVSAALEDRLQAHPFRPCGPLESMTMGFVPPPQTQESGALVHPCGDFLLLCVRIQERLLPAAALADALAARIATIEAQELRTLGRAERKRLRTAIADEMLPQVFPQSKRVLLYLDRRADLLVVDTASQAQADDLVSLLREAADSLPVRPLDGHFVSSTLGAWMRDGSAPADVALDDACELRDPEDSARVVRCAGENLWSEEILNHVRAGKSVRRLAMTWNDGISFVLDQDLVLRKIRLLDAVTADLLATEFETEAQRLDAEFAILGLQLRQLVARFGEIFGTNSDVVPEAA